MREMRKREQETKSLIHGWNSRSLLVLGHNTYQCVKYCSNSQWICLGVRPLECFVRQTMEKEECDVVSVIC
jgi:hypothetical protein